MPSSFQFVLHMPAELFIRSTWNSHSSEFLPLLVVPCSKADLGRDCANMDFWTTKSSFFLSSMVIHTWWEDPWDVLYSISKCCFVFPVCMAEGSEAFCEQQRPLENIWNLIGNYFKNLNYVRYEGKQDPQATLKKYLCESVNFEVFFSFLANNEKLHRSLWNVKVACEYPLVN